MRKVCHWLGLAVLFVAGCRTPAPDVKPPPQPEDYTLPPEGEKRYAQPYQYSPDPNDPSLAPSHRGATGTQATSGMRGGRGGANGGMPGVGGF